MMTYGDGLSDVDIPKLIKNHNESKKTVTMTAIQPSGRFGVLDFDNEGNLNSFVEKPKGDNSWINGGFFILEPGVFEYIDGDNTVWEKEPFEKLLKKREINVYKHSGFWKCMDTLRDKTILDEMWNQEDVPWKLWED